jgi:6-phosphogluconolactonase
MEVKRFEEPSMMYQFLADYIVKSASYCIQKNNQFKLAISGGATPQPLYARLGLMRESLAWKKVDFFWVDERWVPASHADNNFSTAMQIGLEKLGANYFYFNTDKTSPQAASEAYDKLLLEHTHKPYLFDLTLLGAGIDGHTASLFDLTNTQDLNPTNVTSHPMTKQVRVSLSFSSILKSREIIVMLTGEDKRTLLKELMSAQSPVTPIQWVVNHAPHVWIVTTIQ